MLRVRVRVTSDIRAPSFRSIMLPINGALSLRDFMTKILTAAGLVQEQNNDLVLHVDGFVLSLDDRTQDLLRDDDLVYLSTKHTLKNMESLPLLGKRGIEYLDQDQGVNLITSVKPEPRVAENLEPPVQKIEVIQSPSPPQNLLPPRSKKVPVMEPRPQARLRNRIPTPSSSSDSSSQSEVPQRVSLQKRKVTFQRSPVTVQKSTVKVPITQPLNVFAKRPQLNGSSLFHKPQPLVETRKEPEPPKYPETAKVSKKVQESSSSSSEEGEEEVKEKREERKEDQIFTKKNKEEQEKQQMRLQSQRTELTDFVWDSLEKGSEISLQYQYLDETNCQPSVTGWREATIQEKQDNSIQIVQRKGQNDESEPIQLARSDIVTLRLKPKKKEAQAPPPPGEEEKKVEAAAPPPAKPSILRRVKSQIQYYFSDANYYKDIFLRKLEDGQRYVNLKEVMKFRRISNLSRTLQHVQSALQFSKVVELSQDKLKVRKNLTGIS